MKNFRAGLWTLLAKVGPKLFALFGKLGKGAKLTKVGLAGASMGAYSLMFTWQFALALMVMIFIHESGHVWAMKRIGMKTKGIYFLPFLGAAAVAEDQFPSRWGEVYVALMGPVFGFGVSLAAVGLYYLTDNPLFGAIGAWMAMVNLFNLLPINPLDGGRVLKSIVFSIHNWLGLAFMILGCAACVVISIELKLGLFWLLLIVGILEMVGEYVGMNSNRKFRQKKENDIAERKKESQAKINALVAYEADFRQAVANCPADSNSFGVRFDEFVLKELLGFFDFSYKEMVKEWVNTSRNDDNERRRILIHKLYCSNMDNRLVDALNSRTEMQFNKSDIETISTLLSRWQVSEAERAEAFINLVRGTMETLPKPKEKMSWQRILLSTAFFLGIIGALYILMIDMKDIPSVEAALEILS